jgi:hypothetical protein
LGVVMMMMVVVTHGVASVVARGVVAGRMMAGRVVMRRRVMAMMRTGRGRAGRQGQRKGRRERQGDEFQGLSPGFQCVPRIGIRTQAKLGVQTNAERLPRLEAR